jgi:SAM-dependent methyltransferase
MTPPSVQLYCGHCGSTSFYPREFDESVRYVRLYDRAEDDDQFAGQLARLRLELLRSVPSRLTPPPRLQGGDVAILRILEQRLPAKARVVDWGCGSGRLVDALRRRGFDAIGVEVSHELQAAMAASGTPAVHSSELDRLEGPACAAVVLGQVLEHLPDPLDALGQLRSRFPSALFVASVPSPLRPQAVRGDREPWDWPPNHLTWFSSSGLTTLFERAGMDCSVVLPRPTGADLTPPWWDRVPTGLSGRARSLLLPGMGAAPEASSSRNRRSVGVRIASLGLLWAHWCHTQIGRMLGCAGARKAARAGFSCASMVVVGIGGNLSGR